MGEAADVVRRGFELLEASDIEGVVALCDPSIRFHDPPEVPGSQLYEGPDGVRDWVRSAREVSDDFIFRIVALEEKGNAVLAETAAEMHGKSSGVGTNWTYWTVWRVHDGLITYQHGYGRREDAVADFESRPE